MSGRVFCDLDRPIVDAIINPMRSNVKCCGELREGERACHTAGMGLAAHLELPMLQAKASDGTGQDEGMHRGTIALSRQLTGNDLVSDALGTAFEHEPLHLFRACQVFKRPDRNRDLQCCCLSPTPDNTRLNAFRFGSLEDHFVAEAA